MGFAKAKERFFSRGLSSVGGSVCSECLGDHGLARLVEDSASELDCDFCGQESETDPIAVPVDDVVSYMEECISREYEDPANSVGWCSEEGGWLGVTVFDTEELLSDELGLELPKDDGGKLLDTLCEGLGGVTRQWVRIDPYGIPPEDVYTWSWDRFSRLVKHDRRFFLIHPMIPRRAPQDPFALPPGVNAGKAVGVGMAEFQVAWPFTELGPGNDEDFLERWLAWFGQASRGQ